jgi:hypothetical protein
LCSDNTILIRFWKGIGIVRRNLFWPSDEQWGRIEPHLPTDVRGVKRATQQADGARTGFPLKVHAPMLRHAFGYALAMRGTTRGQFKTGSHRSIQHTVRYTELSPARFKESWRN